MAQAVLIENPERVRRKPNSLGVSRVGRTRDPRSEKRNSERAVRLAGLRFSRIFFLSREISSAFLVDVAVGVP